MRKFNVDPTANNDGTALVKILEIVLLVLKLILSGLSNHEAFAVAAAKFNIPVRLVKKYWKKYRAFI